ncbi:hypothetical protein [Hymenobacter sp. GOD-10R]|uniref:hypothetical protein n=1 Tax=Hymenobacter sp. GOD-10R TaxID=3093922 RepID=UPI002D7788AB|nr:hypothetical protein [Hymenobacter sp. GOD-10R]WRQ29812.1 hypothetical protein SD425_05975 [Hymenobacter sp. GOD-10R]
MKKSLLLLAAVAFSTAAFAQSTTVQNEATGAKTTTTVRDNGTMKVESRTGRTEAGQKIHNTKEDAKVAGHKAGHAVKSGAQKTGHAVKKGAKAVKNKAEDVVN